MITPAQRHAWSVDLEAATYRAERAAWYGDRAGAIIAGADARAIAARLRRAALADLNERSAAR